MHAKLHVITCILSLSVLFHASVSAQDTTGGHTRQLKEIAVQGQQNKTPVKIQTISTATYKDQPTTLIELMNRSAGIRIRQTGGLGSQSNLMLNGFQNRAVRYFKDGIPLDYLGAGFDISLVPTNMLDHIEIYKGVLPFSLGADALGGGINMVTAHQVRSFLNASYEYGSFNTHRLSLNGYYKNEHNGLFAGVNAFYNYSDNNYRADVQQADSITGNKKDYNVRLFHNKFNNYFAEAFIGIADKAWADELKLSVTAFGIDREFQFGSSMDKPYGAAKGTQYAIVPTLLYKKQYGNVNISQFFAYSALHGGTTDTAHGTYDWFGNFTYSDTKLGEISNRGSLSALKYKYFASRTNVSYSITPTQELNLNMVINNFKRNGKDPYGYTFTDGTDVLKSPAHYNKIIVAAGLTSNFFNKRLQNSIAGKFYHYNTDASDADYQGDRVNTINSNTAWGFAEALRYNLTNRSTLQASVETALRLPDQDELFGDGNLKLSNFALKPERSLNINLGYKYNNPNVFKAEINTFYRYTTDLILLMPINFMYAQSQNVEKVKGFGMDVDLGYHLLPWLEATGNYTFQNLRLVKPGNAITDKARLRNTPYFFANLGLNARFKKVIAQKDKLNIYWFFSYVREYYLDYIPKSVEPDGFLGLFGKARFNAQNIIPDQQVHSVGFTYYPSGDRYAIGFQARNIFNTNVYDNFRIQNPGRSLSIKLSYSL